MDSQQLLELLRQQIRTGRLDLPMPPETAARVLSVCRNPDAGPMELARLIERDPALMGNVLRIANSAAYAGSERIVSLQHAVARLGSRVVSEIAVAAVVRAAVFAVPRYRDEVLSVWSVSIVAAGWAREIARLCRSNVEGAYLAGLLHAVGRPVLLHVISKMEDQRSQLFPHDLVLEVVDQLHPEAGAELARRWRFPDWVAVAIARHREPSRAAHYCDEVLITALAEQLARWTLDPAAGRLDLTGNTAAAGLRLYSEDLEALYALREQMASAIAA